MEAKLPDARIERSPRAGGIALTIYIAGITGFAVWSLILNHPDVMAGMAPLLHIKGYPVGMPALVESLEMIFLVVMACCFSSILRRTGIKSRMQAEKSTLSLQQECRRLKLRENVLKDTILDLERFSAMATGREERILELKDEVNALLQDMNRPLRYNAAPDEEAVEE